MPRGEKFSLHMHMHTNILFVNTAIFKPFTAFSPMNVKYMGGKEGGMF